MSKISTLFTTFGGTSLGAEWQPTSPAPTSATESGGNLVIESLSGNVHAGVESVALFDWTNSTFEIECAPSQPTALYVVAQAASGLSPALQFGDGSSRPIAGLYFNGAWSTYAVGSANRRFARLTHDGTNFVWTTSDDGVNWTTLHTQAASDFGSVTGSRLRLLTDAGAVTSFAVARVGSAPSGPSAAAVAYYRRFLSDL